MRPAQRLRQRNRIAIHLCAKLRRPTYLALTYCPACRVRDMVMFGPGVPGSVKTLKDVQCSLSEALSLQLVRFLLP